MSGMELNPLKEQAKEKETGPQPGLFLSFVVLQPKYMTQAPWQWAALAHTLCLDSVISKADMLPTRGMVMKRHDLNLAISQYV